MRWLSAWPSPIRRRPTSAPSRNPSRFRFSALARFLESDEGNVKRLQGIEPPLYRLRTQDHRVLFRDHGDYIEVTRVRNRREAYR